MSVSDLPAVNACFNTLSTIWLTMGFVFIRKGRKEAHRNCMIAALCTSALFLAGYLTYHFNAGAMTRYEGEWRGLYLAILFSHIPLAGLVVPACLIAVWHAIKGRYERHVRIVRWLFPVWLYVSVTGVVIYLMLYG